MIEKVLFFNKICALNEKNQSQQLHFLKWKWKTFFRKSNRAPKVFATSPDLASISFQFGLTDVETRKRTVHFINAAQRHNFNLNPSDAICFLFLLRVFLLSRCTKIPEAKPCSIVRTKNTQSQRWSPLITIAWPPGVAAAKILSVMVDPAAAGEQN